MKWTCLLTPSSMVLRAVTSHLKSSNRPAISSPRSKCSWISRPILSSTPRTSVSKATTASYLEFKVGLTRFRGSMKRTCPIRIWTTTISFNNVNCVWCIIKDNWSGKWVKIYVFNIVSKKPFHNLKWVKQNLITDKLILI